VVLTAFHESSVTKYEYALRNNTEDSSSHLQTIRLMHIFLLWFIVFRQN